jgi:hypothetical protein
MKAIERRVRNSSQLNPQGGGEIITKAKRVAFYVRVSTSDQTCASQRQWVCWRDLAHFAKLRGRKCGASPDVPVGDSLYKSTGSNGSLRATTRMPCTAELIVSQRLRATSKYLLISGSQVRVLVHPPFQID